MATIQLQDKRKINMLLAFTGLIFAIIAGELYWMLGGGRKTTAPPVVVLSTTPGVEAPASATPPESQALVGVAPLNVPPTANPFRNVLRTETPGSSIAKAKGTISHVRGGNVSPLSPSPNVELETLGLQVDGVILGGGEPLAIVSIGGSEHVVGRGASFGDGLILEEVTAKSIVVRKGKAKVTIKFTPGKPAPAAPPSGVPSGTLPAISGPIGVAREGKE